MLHSGATLYLWWHLTANLPHVYLLEHKIGKENLKVRLAHMCVMNMTFLPSFTC